MNSEESLNIGYRIAKIIHEAIETTPNITNFWEGHFKDGPNPYYNQMVSGFIIEEYYGNLSRLYTNLGVWNILGDGISSHGAKEDVLNKVKKRLKLKCRKEKFQTKMGENGPWWEIQSIDDVSLPVAIKKEKETYIDYKTSKDIWEKKMVDFGL
jgi:hypothetical protein